MARPGYVEARKARDKEFYLVKECEERLAKVDDLADKDGRPYSSELREIHRKDALTALQKHQQALIAAEAAFVAFSKLPAPKATRQFYDAVLPLQLSVTRNMLDSINRECESKNIKRVELIRIALQTYFDSQADGKPSVNVRSLFSGKAE